MDYPQSMDPNVQGIIIALSLRFAKRKPGLEQDDLINEALIVYDRIRACYDPTQKAQLSTVIYRAVKNQFINMQDKYLTPAHKEIQEEHVISPETLNDAIKEGLQYIKERLTDPAAIDVLDQLTSRTVRKTTIKEICEELGLSFFRYQQCEFKIKQIIKKMRKD